MHCCRGGYCCCRRRCCRLMRRCRCCSAAGGAAATPAVSGEASAAAAVAAGPFINCHFPGMAGSPLPPASFPNASTTLPAADDEGLAVADTATTSQEAAAKETTTSTAGKADEQQPAQHIPPGLPHAGPAEPAADVHQGKAATIHATAAAEGAAAATSAPAAPEGEAATAGTAAAAAHADAGGQAEPVKHEGQPAAAGPISKQAAAEAVPAAPAVQRPEPGRFDDVSMESSFAMFGAVGQMVAAAGLTTEEELVRGDRVPRVERSCERPDMLWHVQGRLVMRRGS